MKEAVRKGKPHRPFLHREQQVFTSEWEGTVVCLEQGQNDTEPFCRGPASHSSTSVSSR